MMRPLVAVTSMILFATSFDSLAQDRRTNIQLANELGTVLASEGACGLSFNQEAITAFIEEQVPEDDMGFPSILQTMITGTEFQLRDMSASARTAHCTQITRIARSYGFID
jgi:hypothetical protein